MKIRYTVNRIPYLLEEFMNCRLQIQCSSVEERRELVEYLCIKYPIETANKNKTIDITESKEFLSVFRNPNFGYDSICVVGPKNIGYWDIAHNLPKINAKDILNKE